MDLAKDERGQTSTEMLLLLGAAVVVAFIVGFFLKSIIVDALQPAAHEALEGTTTGME